MIEERARTLVVGTRASALARIQADRVVERLHALHPRLSFRIQPISTSGDRDRQTPLTQMGGQGVFVKEIEQALLAGSIDFAVHSLKDMPTTQPNGLILAAVLQREDPRDALVSRMGVGLAHLPTGARVGTGSLRRQVQVRAFRPDLEVVALRGNVDTRLRKARTESYDAVILAAAGLLRLGRAGEITEMLSPEIMLPAVGQGAICVEARADDVDVVHLLRSLDHAATRAATAAERAFLRELGGGCYVPIAAYAEVSDDALWLRGLVADAGARRVLRDEARGPAHAAESLGRALARRLLAQGAAALLETEPCSE